MSTGRLALKMNATGSGRLESPAVSIVMATYNRPDVLAAAIRSVLAQQFEDWELIVVGDHCDEATGKTVRDFRDPRIRYINLRFNYGDQSGPNNVGMARAHGRYIAFLNHDDLWFPDHLGGAVDCLEASGADVVIARAASVLPPDPHAAGAGDWRAWISGMGRRGRYDPVVTVAPASSFLFKAEVAAKAGPWRPAIECYLASSQEWLFRVWRSGAVIRTWPHLTVLVITSAIRPGSYRQGSPEHTYFEALLRAPADLRLLLLDPGRVVEPRARWKARAIVWLSPLLRALASIGIPPMELIGGLAHWYSRGEYIDQLRRIRGLDRIAIQDPSPAELRDRYRRNRAEAPLDGPRPSE